MVEIDAYAADCRVHGLVELEVGRLSDQLNRVPELLIRDARLEGLADGRVVEMSEIAIARDELCAVVVIGPRGDVARRLRTRTTHVVVEVGPYLVEGRVHGTPASEPLGVILRQVAWVALTEAIVKYRRGEDNVSEEVATLLVNRLLVSSFRAIKEPGLDFPWEAPRNTKAPAPGSIGLTEAPPGGHPPAAEEADPPPAAKPTA